MVNLARHVEAQRLLEQIAAVEDRLLPNELEMVHHLRAKYGEPGVTDFDDVPVLEVILRNVEIRKGYRIDPRKDAARVYELARKGEDGES